MLQSILVHLSDGLTTVKTDSSGGVKKVVGTLRSERLLMLAVALPASIVKHVPGDSVPGIVNTDEEEDEGRRSHKVKRRARMRVGDKCSYGEHCIGRNGK